jgi:lysophospholipase L1-like esterase
MKFLLISTVLLIIIGLAEFVFVLRNGKPVDVPKIPRQSLRLGKSGPELKYVILGDSTTIGQGADYNASYAYQSAVYLARNHRVTFTNLGVSGARVHDVRSQQLAKVSALHPDIILLAVGANDVTHLTAKNAFRTDLQTSITLLRKDNPHLKILVTGVPDMGAVPRFPWPLRQLAGARSTQFNDIYADIIAREKLVLAPIAAKTGSVFRAHPEYFAQDNFHPNATGYSLWTPIITNALDTALKQ